MKATHGEAPRPTPRHHLVLAVGAAVVVLVALVVLWARRDTGDEPPPSSSSPAERSSTPSSVPGGGRISLGAELLADGRVRLHVPLCPDVVVTELGWVSPSEAFEGVWTLVAVEPAAITQVVPGDEVPGFRVVTPFDGRWDALVPGVGVLASAARESDGDRRRPANLAFAIDELREGEIAYKRRPGPTMAYAGSAPAFQAAVAPDCAAG